LVTALPNTAKFADISRLCVTPTQAELPMSCTYDC